MKLVHLVGYFVKKAVSSSNAFSLKSPLEEHPLPVVLVSCRPTSFKLTYTIIIMCNANKYIRT